MFFPAFSRLREPARIAAMWLRANRMVALVVVPLMLGLIAVAPDFVHAVFGEKWNAAVPVIQILAPVGMIQSLLALNIVILQALDRTSTLFRFTAALSALTVIGFAAGLPWGIEGVAIGYLIVTVATAPIFVRLTTDSVGLRPHRVASQHRRSPPERDRDDARRPRCAGAPPRRRPSRGRPAGRSSSSSAPSSTSASSAGAIPRSAVEIGRFGNGGEAGRRPSPSREPELPDPAALPPGRRPLSAPRLGPPATRPGRPSPARC